MAGKEIVKDLKSLKTKSKIHFNSLKYFFSTNIGKLTGIILVLLFISGIAFGAYYQITKGKDVAKAGLNCTNGSTNLDQNTSEPKVEVGSIVPNQYIVELKTPAEVGSDTGLFDTKNQKLVVKKKLFNKTYLVEPVVDDCKTRTLNGFSLQSLNVPNLEQETNTTIDTVNSLKDNESIEAIIPDILYKTLYTPNDPFLGRQQIVDKIQLQQAWDITQGNASVVVAVIDTGVDFSHQDLVNKLYRDASGKVIGYNYIDATKDPTDTEGHGSGAAGVIAAETNNSAGIAGICPQCKIMPLKIFNSSLSGARSSDLYSALQFAVTNGAKVANMSLGAVGSPSDSWVQFESKFMKQISDAGLTLIASAGNGNNETFEYPASADGVISVAAVNDDDTKTYFSTYNSKVDVSAQGLNVKCTVPIGANISFLWGDSSFAPQNDGYGSCTGTSISAPVVSGVAGLILSKHPEYTPSQVEYVIKNSVDNIDGATSGFVGKLGTGRVNALRALNTVPPIYNIDINTTISSCTPNRNNLNSGNRFNCTFNLSGSPTGTYAIPSQGLYGGIRETTGVENSYLGDSDLCSVSGTVLTCNNIPTDGSSIGSKEIILHQPNVNWYPNKGTINIATKNFTPTTLSSFTCTTPIASGGNSICNGRASGAPNGVRYAGDVIVTVDNGGGASTAVAINPEGFFNDISVPVGTNNTNGNITKIATASIAGANLNNGTANIVVNPADYTIEINTGISNCTPNRNNINSGDRFNCTFNLSGSPTGTYAIPSQKLYAGIRETTGVENSYLRDSDLCSVSGTVLTCNNIPTTNASIGSKEIILHQPGVNFYPNKGTINIVLRPTVDPLFIPDTSLTLTPNPSTGLSVFGDKDYTLVLKDDRIVTTPTQSLNSSAASCTFRIKELSSPTDTDINRGYDKLTSTILSPFNNTGSFNANSTIISNTASKQFEVPYNTNGVSIKILKTNQKYSDYDLEIRCIRSSDNQVFSRDERINFLFGAYAAVGISGVVVR